jgi:hypothetical protein
MTRTALFSLCVMVCAMLSGSLAWSAEPAEKALTASVSFGTEFSSGDYNTGSATRSVYMPLIVSWYPTDRLDLSVELPFIFQSSSRVTTTLYQSVSSTNSQVVARRGGPGGMASGTGGTAAMAGAETSLHNSSGNNSVSYGLGDIILRGGVILFPENGNLPQTRASLFVKTPTASVSEGLGTGEFDFGGGMDLSKWFGDLHLAAEGVYNHQGKVDGFGLNNYVSYNGTIGYQLTDRLQPMLVIKGATAPSIFSGDLLEARARLLWSVTSTTAVDMFASHGISTSSPEYGGGIAVVYSF